MLPYIIVHNAVSLDGRIDWFMPDIGLFYELASRWKEDATLAGSDTILQQPAPEEADTDELPAEPAPGGKRPLLVVPDSRGRIRSWDYLRKQPYWRSIVVLCSAATPASYLEYLGQKKIDRIVAGSDHVDLRAALEELNARYGVKVVRVDSGGTLNGVLLRAGLVQEVSVLVHPCLVGGSSPRSMFRAADPASSQEVIPLSLLQVENLRDDIVWLRYKAGK